MVISTDLVINMKLISYLNYFYNDPLASLFTFQINVVLSSVLEFLVKAFLSPSPIPDIHRNF